MTFSSIFNRFLLFDFVLAVVLTNSLGSEAATVKCGISSSFSHNQRIIGGEETRPHEFPWATFLVITYVSVKDNGLKLFSRCDGSLINQEWVVSAAHCFNPIPNYKIFSVTAVFGAHNLGESEESGRVAIRAKSAYRHSKFNSTEPMSKNDISLIRLQQKLDLEKAHQFISPICLPNGPETKVNPNLCSVIGWGRTSLNNNETSNVLKKVSVQMMDQTKCTASHPEMDDSQVCAGKPNNGPCSGDSGGPLHCLNEKGAYYLEGIVSYGDSHCTAHPAVFTRVDHFIPWIKKVIDVNH